MSRIPTTHDSGRRSMVTCILHKLKPRLHGVQQVATTYIVPGVVLVDPVLHRKVTTWLPETANQPVSYWGGCDVATPSYRPQTQPHTIRTNILQHQKVIMMEHNRHATFKHLRNQRFTQSSIPSLPLQYPNYNNGSAPPMTFQKHHNVPFNRTDYNNECTNDSQPNIIQSPWK